MTSLLQSFITYCSIPIADGENNFQAEPWDLNFEENLVSHSRITTQDFKESNDFKVCYIYDHE